MRQRKPCSSSEKIGAISTPPAYEYPPEVRKIIYTTNIIEGLNRQFRQITKNKPSFTNDDSLRRVLYLASQRIVKHWKSRCQNWDMVLSQLQLMFADRTAGCPLVLASPGAQGGIHAASGAHTAMDAELNGGQGRLSRIPLCFHSAILDFVEFRLHRILLHAVNHVTV